MSLSATDGQTAWPISWSAIFLPKPLRGLIKYSTVIVHHYLLYLVYYIYRSSVRSLRNSFACVFAELHIMHAFLLQLIIYRMILLSIEYIGQIEYSDKNLIDNAVYLNTPIFFY